MKLFIHLTIFVIGVHLQYAMAQNVITTTTTRPPGGLLDTLRSFVNLPTFPTLPGVQLPGLACAAKSNPLAFGTCRTEVDCGSSGGYGDGACLAPANQVCCLPATKCGDTILGNNSVITNPNYPQATEAASMCRYTVRLPLLTIRYVRLEFESLELAPPAGDGRCQQDKFKVEGLAEGVQALPLCGSNSGQHLILPINRAGLQDSFAIKIITAESFARKWFIRVIFLEDGSAGIPPPGCVQYYAGKLEGIISSPNFNVKTNSASGTIDGLRYSSCFRKEAGFCRLKITPVYFNLSPDRVPEATTVDDETSPDGDDETSPDGDDETSPDGEDAEAEKVDGSASSLEAVAPFQPITGRNRCEGLDKIGFPPAEKGKSVSYCGRTFNDGQPMFIRNQPFVMYYEGGQRGRHGLGYQFQFRYVIC